MPEFKMLSWNVNGLRAVLKKNFTEFVERESPDILCIQETKMSGDYFGVLPGYLQFHVNAGRKGYAGVAAFVKAEPSSAQAEMGVAEHDGEGRLLTLEYPDFFLVNVYTPNAQRELARLDYRRQWDRDFLKFLKGLEDKKPVIACGDFNVAHKEIDLKNPASNRRNAGFTDEEREGFTRILESGFIDTFREFNGDPGHYTWWSYMFKARERNVGWRIDYFIISRLLRPRLLDAFILPEVLGSDHCPVGVRIAW